LEAKIEVGNLDRIGTGTEKKVDRDQQLRHFDVDDLGACHGMRLIGSMG